MRRPFIRTGLLVALCTGCGPGGPTGEEGSPPPEPEWAYGWWMSAGGLEDHFEWGAYTMQLEIRPDGTAFQIIDYCNGEDWIYESRWELQPDGSVRLLPTPDGTSLPFLDWSSPGYHYVDIKQSDSSCEVAAVRVADNFKSDMLLDRGRWCIGEYRPEFDDCGVELHCGEAPPICD
jgi:hypothetical protein